MSNFHVGQKVVCVDDSRRLGYLHPLVVMDKIYTVRHVMECPGCGMQSIDVGFAPRSKSAGCICGAVVNTYGHQVHGANRFKPFDNLSEQIERIESEGAFIETEQTKA